MSAFSNNNLPRFFRSTLMSDQFVSNASTTLAAAVTSTSATTISVTSTWGFPSAGNFLILIDAEVMRVTAVSGATWTVARGVNGSTAATHALGAYVTGTLTLYANMFGAVGDGVADDTAAIQNAINAAQSSGGTVCFSPGKLYRTTATLNI